MIVFVIRTHSLESFGMERTVSRARSNSANGDAGSRKSVRTIAIKGFDWGQQTAGLNQTTPKWLKVRRSTMVSSGPLVHKGHRDGAAKAPEDGIELVSSTSGGGGDDEPETPQAAPSFTSLLEKSGASSDDESEASQAAPSPPTSPAAVSPSSDWRERRSLKRASRRMSKQKLAALTDDPF